jgi:hypothetical protein
MSDVNWGILQPISQIRSQEGPAPQSGPGAPSGPPLPPPRPDQTQGLLAKAKLPGELQAQGLQNALAQQALNRNEQLLPGEVQGQQLTNTGQGLLNQKSQMDLSNAQYQLKMRQLNAQAYQEGEARGGVKGGFEAVQEQKAKMGDIDGAINLGKTVAEMDKNIQEANKEGIASIATGIYNLQKQARPPTPAYKDPKTGQIVPADPGVSALDLYTNAHKIFKQNWQNAPDPSDFKNAGAFEDEVVHPILAMAGPIVQQQALDLKAKTDNDLYKAQQVVKSNQQALQDSIKQDPNSQATKDAAVALQQSQRDATRVSIGGGQGSLGSIQNYTNGPASTSNIIKQNTPAPAPTPAIPDGRVAVTSPDGTIGHIPQSQLNDAMKAGYAPVQQPAAAQQQAAPEPAPVIPGVTPGTMSITPSQQSDSGQQ